MDCDDDYKDCFIEVFFETSGQDFGRNFWNYSQYLQLECYDCGSMDAEYILEDS